MTVSSFLFLDFVQEVRCLSTTLQFQTIEGHFSSIREPSGERDQKGSRRNGSVRLWKRYTKSEYNRFLTCTLPVSSAETRLFIFFTVGG